MPPSRRRRPSWAHSLPHGGRRADHYLARTLITVEGRLNMLYAHRGTETDEQRIASVLAGTDPRASVWDKYLQARYLENAREGLLSTLRALRQTQGRGL